MIAIAQKLGENGIGITLALTHKVSQNGIGINLGLTQKVGENGIGIYCDVLCCAVLYCAVP